jgi:hypothetical protein
MCRSRSGWTSDCRVSVIMTDQVSKFKAFSRVLRHVSSTTSSYFNRRHLDFPIRPIKPRLGPIGLFIFLSAKFFLLLLSSLPP